MARRFVFQAGGSPFRISAVGQDALSAGFENVLFDGKYVSMPIYANVGFAGSPGDYAINLSGGTLQYANVNTYTFGKTFSAPPMFSPVGPGRAANTYNYFPWVSGSTYTYARMSAISCQRPYFVVQYGPGVGGTTFAFGVFATTTALRSNRPGRFLIFDKPLS